MIRLLILVVVVSILAYFVSEGIRRLKSLLQSAMSLSEPKTQAVGRPQRRGGLIACAACGVYVPRGRAILGPPAADGKLGSSATFFCSSACCRAAGRSH